MKPDSRPFSIARVSLAAGAALVGLVTAPSAHAVLGGTEATIGADHARLHAVGRSAAMTVRGAVQAHEITLGDGSSIREYVNASGVVFAIAWSTRLKPRLPDLLGNHAPAFSVAAARATARGGIQRHVVLQQDDLVVRASSHLNSHIGIAYLRSQLPEGVSVDALR